jgi:hypothetical protein
VKNMSAILGFIKSHDQADNAIDVLKSAGFNANDISIMVKESPEFKTVTAHVGEKVVGGTTAGIAGGAVIGGIAGLLTGIGAIAIPGIGGFLIGGPIAAALGLTGAAATTATGAATGALAGGLIGALTSLGIPREKVEVYERKLKEGAILIAVSPTDEREDEAKKILERNGATDIVEVAENRFFEPKSKEEDHARHHAAF